MNLPVPIERSHAEFREVLLSSAFDVVEGPAYNRVAGEMREQAQGSLFVLYEIVIETHHPWEYLRGQVYPSFIRYLKYKSLDPGTAQGVIVSLFFGHQFYLIRGPQFMKAFCEIEGIDENELGERVAEWLSEVNP